MPNIIYRWLFPLNNFELSLFVAPAKPPSSVVAHDLSFDKIRLEWREVNTSYAHGVILGYKMTLYELGNAAFQIRKEEKASATFTVFDGLKDSTKYFIGILAYNKFGEGPPQTVYGKTRIGRKYI